MQNRIEAWFHYNRLLAVFTVIGSVMLILVWFGYTHYSHGLIQSVYQGTAFGPLNKIIQGQNVHSLEFYLSLADQFFNKAYSVAIVFFVLTISLWVTIKQLFIRIALQGDIRTKKFLEKSIAVFPLVFLGCLIILKLGFVDHYHSLVNFEGVLEHLQSLCYFITAIVSTLIALRFWKKNKKLFSILYFIFALACVFVSLEEISWGQRIFRIETPEYFHQRNIQNELTLHNLEGMQNYLLTAYLLVGFFGAFTRFLLPKSVQSKYPSIINNFVPDKILMLYFLPVAVFYIIFETIQGPHAPVLPQEQEPTELLLSLGFLLFVSLNLFRHIVSNKTAASPSK